MKETMFYNTLLHLLVGDLRSEDELVTILNFLDHARSVIRHVYWAKRLKNNYEEDNDF